MAEEFCSYHLKGLGQLLQFHRTTLLSLCVLHFIFSPVATLGNVLVIRAMLKASKEVLPESCCLCSCRGIVRSDNGRNGFKDGSE